MFLELEIREMPAHHTTSGVCQMVPTLQRGPLTVPWLKLSTLVKTMRVSKSLTEIEQRLIIVDVQLIR